MPRSPTPADRSCQAIATCAMLPSAQSTTSAPQSSPVEALSRGLPTPCVRFAAGVAPGPRNTRFRLVANLYRVRTLTCWVTQGGFRQSTSHYMTSSSSRLRLVQTPRSFSLESRAQGVQQSRHIVAAARRSAMCSGNSSAWISEDRSSKMCFPMRRQRHVFLHVWYCDGRKR